VQAGRRVGSETTLSALEESFLAYLHMLAPDAPAPAREYRFASPRRWKFDFAWPDARLAVEIEGGTWSGGRHTRGAGYANDCTKYNAAVLEGWRVLRYTTLHFKDPHSMIAEVMEALSND